MAEPHNDSSPLAEPSKPSPHTRGLLGFATRVLEATAQKFKKLDKSDKRLSALAAIVAIASALVAVIPAVARWVTEPEPAEASPSCRVTSAEHERSGYVLLDEPPSTRFTVTPTNQCNSAQASVIIERLRAGRYVVQFSKLGVDGGTAEVTPIGDDFRVCTLVGWGPDKSGRNELLEVACFDRSGMPTDSAFSARFIFKRGFSGATAYVRSTSPGKASAVAVDAYHYNSKGGSTSIDRRERGWYKVFFGRQQESLDYGVGGTVKVTAISDTLVLCNVQKWFKFSARYLAVEVQCRDASGKPVDSRFATTYSGRLGRTPEKTVPGAYVWADQPATSQYTPSDVYQYSSRGLVNKVARVALGTYRVRLPGLVRKGGNVQVSGYGSAANCVVRALKHERDATEVEVKCWALATPPRLMDSQFALTYWQ